MPGSGPKQIKVRINYVLDRVIDTCDLLLMDAYRVRWEPLQKLLHRGARVAGDLCWLLRDFPSVSVYRASDPNWTIVFAGSGDGFRQICRLVFPAQDVEKEEIGRTYVWHLQRLAQQWLAHGAHLVILEQCRFQRNAQKVPLSYDVPAWVQQTVSLSSDAETMLAGSRRKAMRNRISKAHRAGFTYHFSTAEEDFAEFYKGMYLPYVRERHGNLSLIAPREDLRNRWFRRGGIVLVATGNQSVAGALVYVAFRTCYLIETGVLENDQQLRDQEINAFLFSSVMAWARSQGAIDCDLGGSRAYCVNGSFCFKRDWGARVTSRKRIHPVWRFLAWHPLPESLVDHINALGLISEIRGGFYRVVLDGGRDESRPADVERSLQASKHAGLSGVVRVSPFRQELFDVDHNCPG